MKAKKRTSRALLRAADHRHSLADARSVDQDRYRRLVGLRLRAARRACGFGTARAFARALRVPEGTITSYERGERWMPYCCLAATKALLRLSIDFIVTGDLDRLDYALARQLQRALPPEAVRRRTA